MNKENIFKQENSNSLLGQRFINFAERNNFEIISEQSQTGYIVFKGNQSAFRPNETLEVTNVLAKHKNSSVPGIFFIMLFLHNDNVCAASTSIVVKYQKIN